MEALEKVGPSLTKEIINFYEKFEKSHKNNLLIKDLTSKSTNYDFQWKNKCEKKCQTGKQCL